MRWLTLAIAVLAVTPVNADPVAGEETGQTRILVTFADPGMSNSARAGPAGPGYRRRSSGYLVSVGVRRAANRIAREFDLTAVDEWPIIPLKVHCLVFAVADDAQVDELLTRIRSRPEVDSAQLLNEFEVTASIGADHDPYSELQHNLLTLELTQAHNWSLGDGTTITIIDTGADLEHPELRTQIASHRDFVGIERGAFSADAHGTAIAGVIGAATNNGTGMMGVAPRARLTVLRACWHDSNRPRAVCDSFTLAKALSYAIETQTDVINLSLDGPSDALLARLVAEALEGGVVVVAAAPVRAKPGFPAEIRGVIVVGSYDRSEPPDGRRRFPINAPGQDILVPVPHGGYDYASGSSLAAAHVSGIAALLVARRPGLAGDRITALLVNSRAAPDESVNACRALAELLQQTGCRGTEALSQIP